MCAATAAVVAGTVATVATAGIGVAQSMGAMGGGSSGGAGGFTEKQLKGFGPTRALQSYSARLLAENATATRPSLQEFAASGGTAKYPIKDTGFTPEEAAALGIVDPHTGLKMPFVDKSQENLTTAQQMFLGQQRARQGATGPLAQYGKLGARQKNLQSQLPTADPTQSTKINTKLGKIGDRLTKLQNKLQSGG